MKKTKKLAKPKVDLKTVNERLMQEVEELNNYKIQAVQEGIYFRGEIRRLKLKEQEQLAVIDFLRKGVIGLEEKLSNL